MVESQIYLKKRPRKLKTAIVGFPGVGMIGLSTTRLLLKQLKPEKVGEILSPYFPHQATMLSTGMLRATKVVLYRYKDILLVIGDIQPHDSVGQYELAYKLVELFKKLKISQIITIGGYVVKRQEEAGQAYLVGNNRKLLKEWAPYGKIGKAKGVIVGLAGLIPVIAKHYKIPALTLLITTPGGFYDVTAMKEAATVLSKALNVPVDFKDIDKRIEKTKEVIERIKSEVEHKEKETTSTYIR